jgi:hypothetical protein
MKWRSEGCGGCQEEQRVEECGCSAGRDGWWGVSRCCHGFEELQHKLEQACTSRDKQLRPRTSGNVISIDVNVDDITCN